MIAIIQYNAGNSTSVRSAMQRLGAEAVVTSDPDLISTADKVIFPGVGEASTAMNFLRETKLDQVIKSLTTPVLGICLGQQLLCNHTAENDTTCLGIFPISVKAFPSTDIVPHMGWNNFLHCEGQLFPNVSKNDDVYFVHSFYVEPSVFDIATTEYILPFASAIHRDNFYAVQFHVEKSGAVGERILHNFLDL